MSDNTAMLKARGDQMSYINKKNVDAMMTFLFQEVCVSKPEDPSDFLIKLLTLPDESMPAKQRIMIKEVYEAIKPAEGTAAPKGIKLDVDATTKEKVVAMRRKGWIRAKFPLHSTRLGDLLIELESKTQGQFTLDEFTEAAFAMLKQPCCSHF